MATRFCNFRCYFRVNSPKTDCSYGVEKKNRETKMDVYKFFSTVFHALHDISVNYSSLGFFFLCTSGGNTTQEGEVSICNVNYVIIDIDFSTSIDRTFSFPSFTFLLATFLIFFLPTVSPGVTDEAQCRVEKLRSIGNSLSHYHYSLL